MAKTSGLGQNFYVGGYNLSGDVGSFGTIGVPQKTLDVTGIDKGANERIGGQRDGAMDFMAFFNPETIAGGGSRDGAHKVLSALPTADVGTMLVQAPVVGAAAFCMIGKQINYDPTRDNSGALTIKTSVAANGFGAEWGNMLTAGIRADTAATLGAAIDNLAATAFGWQAYLQVAAFTGTDATIKLQDSADNVTFTDLAGGAFTALPGAGAPLTQRIQSVNTATIRRYVRVVTTTVGGFTSAKFAVAVIANPIAGVTF
jgi:autotransporter adhesin